MTSYISLVLTANVEAEFKEVKEKFVYLQSNVPALLSELKEYLHQCYGDDIPSIDEDRFVAKCESIREKFENLKEQAHTLNNRSVKTSEDEFQIIMNELLVMETTLDMVKNLCAVDENIKSSVLMQDNQQYAEAGLKLKMAEEILCKHLNLAEMDIYTNLLRRIIITQEFHAKEILMGTRLHINWYSFKDPTDECVTKNSFLVMNKTKLNQSLNALICYNHFDREIENIASETYEILILPIIVYNAALETKICDENFTVELEFRADEEISDGKKRCTDIMGKLTEVIDILRNIFTTPVEQSEETIMRKMGRSIGRKLVKYFTRKCLYVAIPMDTANLSEFGKFSEKVLAFDEYLKSIEIVSADDTTICSMIGNIGQLCDDKIFTRHYELAKAIFVKDLHDKISVGTQDSELEILEGSYSELCPNTFRFPKCYISKSTKELVELFAGMLGKCEDGYNDKSVKMFSMIRQIAGFYIEAMPKIHKHVLKAVPQHAALFHNNCMYLAHHLGLWTMSLCNKSTLEEGPYGEENPLSSRITTFIDLYEPFKALAEGTLNLQIKIQQDAIMESLKNSEVDEMSPDCSKLPESVSKANNQCLKKMNLVKTVWQDILPNEVYAKAVGNLCNVMLGYYIEVIFSYQDISMDMSAVLRGIIELMISKMTLLFRDARDIYRNVKHWGKTEEMLLLLNAGLKDIEARWCDGKGPLALTFPAERVKHIIRALFENTQHRTNLISRIY